MKRVRLTRFVHPHKVYWLEHPEEWEMLEKEDHRSCGFGPKEREDVGLWISILPMSVDSDVVGPDLPKIFQNIVDDGTARDLRKDRRLRHTAVKADCADPKEGGYHWLLTGGDVVLLASSTVPPDQREQWNPIFDKVMESLTITRDAELLMHRGAGDVLRKLQELHPEENFEFDEQGIKGESRRVFLANFYRDLKASPRRRAAVVDNFVKGLATSLTGNMGHETWEDAVRSVVPLLKPKEYLNPDGPTRHLLVNDWLEEVIVCYALKDRDHFRFVTGWDADRWGHGLDEIHEIAIANLAKLDWPSSIRGPQGTMRSKEDGLVVFLETNDSLASSRLLHPGLHAMFARTLGSPFRAGIPDRGTLVLFSDREELGTKMRAALQRDHDQSSYPITATPFLVTADGVVLDTK